MDIGRRLLCPGMIVCIVSRQLPKKNSMHSSTPPPLELGTASSKPAGCGRRILWSAAAGMALALVFLLLRDHPPAESNLYPACLFHQVTGLHCPGCGASRCLYALSHLDAAEAIHQNVLVVMALPFAGWWTARAWWRWLWQAPARPMKSVGTWVYWSIAVVIILFGVLRNLPWLPLSALAPH